MKRTILVATMATLMTLPAMGSALARGPGKGDGQGPGKGCMGQALKAANLTADQQQRLKGMRQQQKEKVAPLREQVKTKTAEVRALWQADAPNRTAILAKHDELDGLRRQMRVAQIDHRLAMLGVLTPEQRAAFRAQAQSCGLDDEGHGRHGKGPGPGAMGGE